MTKPLAACALALSAALLAACAPMQTAPATASASTTTAVQPVANEAEPVVVLVPMEMTTQALQSGCWAQLYDDSEYKGDMLTLMGPVELQSLDRSTGRQLRRSIDSIVTGPRARLTVFEHRLFRDRSVVVEPNSKAPSVARALGSTGRVESLRLDCA